MEYVDADPESVLPPGAFRTDIFCIEDVDDAPVYH